MKITGGAAAMLLETRGRWLLGVLTPNDNGGVEASIVLLRAAPPPTELPEFLALLRSPTIEGGRHEALAKAQKTLDDAIQWIRATVLPELRGRLTTIPPMLLWSPHGLAAGVPLGTVWSDLPSIWTTPCLTRPPPTITHAKDARQSALLVFAEPVELDPIADDAETMARIAQSLHNAGGRVQALFGTGRRGSSTMRGGHGVPGLVAAAPTPNEVKRRLADQQLSVILAHGQYNDAVPEKSALALMNSEGRAALLTADALAETPDLLHEA